MKSNSLTVLCAALFVTIFGCDDGRPPPGPGGIDAAMDAGGDAAVADAGPADASRGDAALEACVAECGPRTCGDDGCGGSCGTCASGESCEDGGCVAPMDETCPPVEPYGTDVGDIAPDVTLLDCDGVEHSLHDLCDAPVSWVFEYAEWCPVCRDFAPTAQMLYDRHEPDGLRAFVVISAADDFGPPDAALCAEVRMRYGLTMPVLYDPTGAFASTLEAPSNDYNLIMTRGMRIAWEGHYADSSVEGQLAAAFAP